MSMREEGGGSARARQAARPALRSIDMEGSRGTPSRFTIATERFLLGPPTGARLRVVIIKGDDT